MNARRVLLSLTLAAFVAEAVAVTVVTGGLGATAEAMFANAVTRFMLFETALCLVMAAVWMSRDAQQRGVNPLPYLALTVVGGAAGPLLYFVKHPKSSDESRGEVSAGAAQPA